MMRHAKGVSIGLDISQNYISAVELELKGQKASLSKSAVIDVSGARLTPLLDADNLPAENGFKDIIKRLFEKAGINGKNIALALPDGSVKTLLLEFETIPSENEKIIELVKWSLKNKRNLPFPVEEAVIDFQTIGPSDENKKTNAIFATVIKKNVLNQYKELIHDCGLNAEVIMPSFAATYNVYHDKTAIDGPALFFALSSNTLSVAALENGAPRFYRTKAVNIGNGELTAEVLASLNYYSGLCGNKPHRAAFMGIDIDCGVTIDALKERFAGAGTSILNLTDVITCAGKTPNIFSAASGAAFSALPVERN